jgi:hypothetical protein
MNTGHAPHDVSAHSAAAHYDNTGAAVADVAVGEDAHGIWFAGRLRPGTPAQQRDTLAAAALSGDWRGIRGNLELVAALAVNVPGFPVPRVSLAASGGQQTSLVAAGIVRRPEHLPAQDGGNEALAVAVVDEMERRAARRARAAKVREDARALRAARLLEA